MDTRELFERLVTDEPPLGITGLAMKERGHQAARRRLGRVGAVVVAVLVVGTVGVTQLAGPDQRHRGTLVPVAEPPITAIPFVSDPQAIASNAQVHQLLMARAAVMGSNVQGTPFVAYDTLTGAVPAIETWVAYAVGGEGVVLDAVASAAPGPGNGLLPGVQKIGRGSPCSQYQPGDLQRPTGCVRTPLAGGAQEWTF
jgi:hypothetical protein